MVNTMVDASKKKFVRYREGAALYSMGMTKFQKLSKDAHARIKVDGIVLVNREIFDRYLEAKGE